MDGVWGNLIWFKNQNHRLCINKLESRRDGTKPKHVDFFISLTPSLTPSTRQPVFIAVVSQLSFPALPLGFRVLGCVFSSGCIIYFIPLSLFHFEKVDVAFIAVLALVYMQS